MEGPRLKKVLAKAGCEGCWFDTNGGCDVDKYIEVKGLPIPDPSLWDCGGETDSFIFVPEED